MTTQITSVLDDLADNADWTALAPVLRRIIGGDRDPELLSGLDEIDAIAIALLRKGTGDGHLKAETTTG